MRLIAFFCGLLALVAQPAAAATFPSLQSLEQQLALLVAGKTGEFGIAALDMRSGELISVNGDQPFPMASTVKVAVAAAYLAQVDAGRRSLTGAIGGRTAAEVMELMITRSDNVATDQILRNLGGPKTVQQWLDFHQLSNIRIDRTIAQLLADRRDLRDIRDSSTPKAMIDLLRTIDRGNVLKPESRSYLLALMARCTTGSNRIRGLLPPGTPVENKTGTLNGLTDDVGFITLPDGNRIAIAIFGRFGTNRPRTIAEAARAIYDGFTSALSSPFIAAFSTPYAAPR